MQGPDKPYEHDTPEAAWNSPKEEEHKSMQIALTPEELCALAQSREKLNARVLLGVAVVTVALAAALLYNVYRIDQPWSRLGQAWMLGVIVYLFGPAFERRRRPGGASEPCAQFLARQHEERQRGYQRIRPRLFLFIPGIVASLWGGGPLTAARARGIDSSSWYYHFLAGPWPFVLTMTALVLVWFAFGKAAEKAARDREELQHAIAP
jgi:hypothetical protein